MFFRLHILIFITFISKINNLVLKQNAPESHVKENENISSLEVFTHNSSRTYTTSKLFYQILKNLTNVKNLNLKSNVFDKMLSDEMLSIKQHFYDKDISYSVPIQITHKSTVATPTLVVKQKWPAVEYTKSSVHKDYLTSNKTSRDENNITAEYFDNATMVEHRTSTMRSKQQRKVLGLRSLSGVTYQDGLGYTHAYKMCTCMRTNPSIICSHRFTVGNSKTCTHSERCHDIQSKCTRAAYTYPIYSSYYISYQPYFYYVTTETPNEITYLYTKRPKYSKTRKPYIEDDFSYDSAGNKDRVEEYYDKYYDEDDKHKTSKPPDTIKIDVHYYDNTKDKYSRTEKYCHDGHAEDSEGDKLVNDIVNDLQNYYSDTVLKKCYCSSALRCSKYYITIWSQIVLYLCLFK